VENLDAWPQNTIKTRFFCKENQLLKWQKMVLFQEFISDPKTSSYSEDKQQGLHQENT
jgi:hypothetical protein